MLLLWAARGQPTQSTPYNAVSLGGKGKKKILLPTTMAHRQQLLPISASASVRLVGKGQKPNLECQRKKTEHIPGKEGMQQLFFL